MNQQETMPEPGKRDEFRFAREADALLKALPTFVGELNEQAKSDPRPTTAAVLVDILSELRGLRAELARQRDGYANVSTGPARN